jgi:hypothetical protein
LILPIRVKVTILWTVAVLFAFFPILVKMRIVSETLLALIFVFHSGIVWLAAAAAAARGVFTTPTEILWLRIRQCIGGIGHGLHGGIVFFELGGIGWEWEHAHGSGGW